jgi:FtsH-binding integral membrane protein
VGVLVSVGVCLFCLKGSTDREDVLLNLAGMFALVVALVPTRGTGSCASVLGTAHDRDVNIANNFTALLAVGLLGLLILAFLATKNRPTRPEFIGFAVAALVFIATALIFWWDRDFFVRYAHYTAAVLMFTCILIVVGLNALSYKDKTDATSPRNRYAAVAGAMLGSSAVITLAGILGWDHWVLVIEAALIGLFAVFWLIQTIELWHEGLR